MRYLYNLVDEHTINNNIIQNPLLYQISIGIKWSRLPNHLTVFHKKLKGLSKPFNILNLHILRVYLYHLI